MDVSCYVLLHLVLLLLRHISILIVRISAGDLDLNWNEDEEFMKLSWVLLVNAL